MLNVILLIVDKRVKVHCIDDMKLTWVEHEQAEHMDNTEWENEKPKDIQKSEPYTTKLIKKNYLVGQRCYPPLVISPEIKTAFSGQGQL